MLPGLLTLGMESLLWLLALLSAWLGGAWQDCSFVCGVQWHPEFHRQASGLHLLECTPLLELFLAAVQS